MTNLSSNHQCEDDDSSSIENSQPTKFDKIDEKENSLSTNSKSNMLCIHENSNECPCPNEDVPPGVTQSSIVILGSHDKSTSMSPLQTLTDEDSSIP
ncbi:unnamed protein product [Rotaria sordida]|uniref:Uncharacterized protein n=1 Tax=Rotaria sordida TaxID=392033 RepID=A0A819RWE5_9BILA|nr:unnamed protein product [Rotaria sordida]